MSRRDSKPHERSRSNGGAKPRPAPGASRSQTAPVRHTGSKRPELQDQHHHDRRRHSAGESGLAKLERVQKVLAHAGLGSRRSCEDLIKQGRVSVDGQVIRELGTRVDPDRARIAVDGEAIRRESMVYYAVNKPKGYVSTNVDPAGRPRVVDLLPEIPERVYSVGRLDEESTGLMILTNDGELANRLAHPRYGVEKLYRALIAGAPDQAVLAKLTAGVWLSDGKIRAKRARLIGRQGQANVLELVLAEGKNREIRRMLAKLGHKVMSLNRVAVGPISVKGLSSGAYRSLSRHEVDLLWKVADGASVSLPRFLDDESSPRTPRDSSHQRHAGHGRTGRGQAGQPRIRHGDSGREPSPARRSKQPPMPPRANQSHRSQSHRPDVAPENASLAPGSLSGRPRDDRRPDAPKKKGAPLPKRATVNAQHPPVPELAKRRIIGLAFQPPSAPGPYPPRERGRKRPPPRTHRPSPTPSLKRPTDPVRRPRAGGEDA
jgi:23S rRNA pseudouridine2605 synthase